jgi:hypothetical protein
VTSGACHVQYTSSASQSNIISCRNQQTPDATHHEKEEFNQQKNKPKSQPKRHIRQTIIITMKENVYPFCLAFCATGIG